MNEVDDADYTNGYNARSIGLLKNSCPFSIRRIRRRMAWIGGYNDRDSEIKLKLEIRKCQNL